MPIILENGLSYSDILDFEEIDHSEPSIDHYGLDTFTRTFEGRNSLLNAFLATWLSPAGVPLNTADTEYAGMYCIAATPSRARAFSQVQVKFTGKISGAEPLPTIKDTWTENTAQLIGGTDDAAVVPDFLFPISVDYFTGGTSYEYYAAARPSEPRYPSGASTGSIAISTVTTGADGIINTATAHGLSVGDYIVFAGVTGTTPDINDVNIVKAVTDSDTFTIETNVTVGGTGGTVTPLEKVWSVTRVRGQTLVDGLWYPALQAYATFDQDMTQFTREQVGLWWKCNETWEWKVSTAFTDPIA